MANLPVEQCDFGLFHLLRGALFGISATAPLLQKWFARTGHPSSGDPYFLYSASNLGSMLALISYPTLIEPNFRLVEQGRAWAIGYIVILALTAFCARVTRKYMSVCVSKDNKGNEKSEALACVADDSRLTYKERGWWVLLAFVPSSMMLGVTTFLSTDVAAIPLFWVIPLSLYLLSFIIVFARGFFGVLTVTRDANGRFMNLSHGTTLHGMQWLNPINRLEPVAYYHLKGPAGQVFSEFKGRKKKSRIAVTGLGTGSLAPYAGPGQEIDFYEIDQAVKKISTNPDYFSFLSECKANWRVILGDARFTMEKAPPHSYGIIILDAFSSDAIPVHLLTKEAVNLSDRLTLSQNDI